MENMRRAVALRTGYTVVWCESVSVCMPACTYKYVFIMQGKIFEFSRQI